MAGLENKKTTLQVLGKFNKPSTLSLSNDLKTSNPAIFFRPVYKVNKCYLRIDVQISASHYFLLQIWLKYQSL